MRRTLALLLALMLLAGSLPAAALASGDEYHYPMDSVEKLEGTIANASNTYVIAKGYHGAIIDLQGLDYDTVTIRKDPNAQTMGYAFLRAMPVVGQVPDYAGQYYAVVWDASESAELAIPGDAAYLYIYYNSKDIVYLPASVVFRNATDWEDPSVDEPDWDVSSITVATWNIGHFSLGTNPSSKITDAKFQESVAAYRTYLYDQVGADLITLNEYSAMFTPSYRAKNALFSDYTGAQLEGPQYRYSCNALFSKLPVSGLRACTFACNQNATIEHTAAIKATDYYYLQGQITLGGETVVVVTAHLGFDKMKTPDTVCLDQIDELIRSLQGYDRVLLMGDWNTREFSYFDRFVAAGYTLGNTDPNRSTFMYDSTNRALDNIIVKGLDISDFRVHMTQLSDHYAVSATVSLSYDAPAHVHQYSFAVTDPTCTQQGYTTYTCTACGESYMDDFVEATGHEPVVIDAEAATCTQEGLTEGRKCCVCDQILQEQTPIPTTDHSYGPWQVVKSPDGTLEERQCTVCGSAQQRPAEETADPADPVDPTASLPAGQDTFTIGAQEDTPPISPALIAVAVAALAAIAGVVVWLLRKKK